MRKGFETAKSFGLQINLGVVLSQKTGKVYTAMFFVVNYNGFDFHVFFRVSVNNTRACISFFRKP